MEDGVALDAIWAAELEARELVEAPDVNGDAVRTSPHLVAFRNWLVEQTDRQGDRRFVNATEGGILHGGLIATLPLRAAIDRFCGTARSLDLQGLHRSTRCQTDALLAAARRALDAGDEVSPWPEWNAFAGASRTPADIRAALRDAVASLEAGDRPAPTVPTAPPASDASRLPLPERSAVLKTLLIGTAAPDWLRAEARHRVTSATGVDAPRIGAALDTLIQAVEARMESGQDAGTVASLPTAPPSSLPGWTPEVRRELRAAEGRIAEAVMDGLATAASDGASYLAGMADPPCSLADGQPRDVAPAGASRLIEAKTGDAARYQAFRLWLRSRLGLDRGSRMGGLEATQVWRGLDSLLSPQSTGAERRVGTGARCTFTVRRDGATGDRLRLEGQAGLWELSHALTGTLAPVAGSGEAATCEARWSLKVGEDDDGSRNWRVDIAIRTDEGCSADPARAWALGENRRWLAPTVLTGRGTARAAYAATLDDRAAVLVGAEDGRSYRVDEAGGTTPLAAWPLPIYAEAPWGPEGGRLAWRVDSPSCLLFRPSVDGAVVRVDVPFRPLRMAADPDGRPVWTSLDGGLWTWTPGEPAARRIAEVGPAVDVCWQDGAFRIGALPVLPDGRMPRIGVDASWRWTPGAAAPERVAVGPEGQSYATATGAGLTARAHATADLVRLTLRDGRTFNLMVYAPVAVGWAGRSLLVVTGLCDVLLFPDLPGRLEAGSAEGARAEEVR